MLEPSTCKESELTYFLAVIKIHEPVGVIGIACPEDYPLLGFVSLFAPAIARSNSVVVVPSQKYPLLALDMYQVFDTSDLPGGVLNILTGTENGRIKNYTKYSDY